MACVSLALVAPSLRAEWQPTGPFGGEAEIVRVVPEAPGMVIGAARNGLMFLSRNGGAFWTNIPFPGEFSGVLHALEVDPRVEGTWYAGMEGDHAFTSGVYKTVDGGVSWTPLPGMTGKKVWSLALWPANPDVIAAGTADGVYRSDNGGAAWTRISAEENHELSPVVSLAFDPAQKKILYAGTTHLPWRTGDGGATWESIHAGMIDDSDVFSMQVDKRNPQKVYASACSGVYESSDGAAHWTRLPTPPGAFRAYFVSADPVQERVIFAGTSEGLLKSADGGKIWHQVSAHAVRSIAFEGAPGDRIFFASTTGGMLVSNDGGRTLHESNFGFANRSFTAMTSAGGVLYANSVYEPGSGGIYRSDNLGLRWVHSGNEPAGQQILLMSAVPDRPGMLFAAGYHGLLKSVDEGKTWTAQQSVGEGRVTSLVALDSGTLLLGTDAGLFRGTGNNWRAVTPTGVTDRSGGIQSLQRSGEKIVAALAGNGAFVSGDAGIAWKRCGKPSPSAGWYGLAFDSAAANGIGSAALAATSEGLFRSADGCRSWSKVLDGMQSGTVSVVIFNPARAGEAYASQGGRVFHSADGGARWAPLNRDSHRSSWPTALLVLPSDPERLLALFPRRGIFLNTVEGSQPATGQ